MIPQSDAFPEQLERVVVTFISAGREAALLELKPISYPTREIPKRPTLSRAEALAVYRRDRWTCRYCGGRTIYTPVMALLGSVFPEDFPFHPNWKSGITHPAVIARSAVVDHVLPGSRGGSWTDRANLVTACWPCNERKGDLTLEQLGWELRPVPESTWDGLTSAYRALWEAAGSPDPKAHAPLLKLLATP